MDGVSCDFIERVFSQLGLNEINFTKFQSPLWVQVERGYRDKLQCLNIGVYITTPATSFQISMYKNETYSIADCTTEGLNGMDARFTRVNSVTFFNRKLVMGECIEHPLDCLTLFLQSISRFWLNFLNFTMCSTILTPGIECLGPRRLETNYSPETYEYLKNQLKSEKLRELQLRGGGSDDLKSHIEAFVCRPQFKLLHCEFTSLDMDCLQRIVAYWKAHAPWKSALVEVTISPYSELEKEFSAWLTPTENKGEFQEQNGESDLVVSSKYNLANRRASWIFNFGY